LALADHLYALRRSGATLGEINAAVLAAPLQAQMELGNVANFFDELEQRPRDVPFRDKLTREDAADKLNLDSKGVEVVHSAMRDLDISRNLTANMLETDLAKGIQPEWAQDQPVSLRDIIETQLEGEQL
jgi:hypothetical protein